MQTALGYLIVAFTAAAILAVWLLLYTNDRLPKWLTWLLTTVICAICCALILGVYYAFQWGYVVTGAASGIVAGVGGCAWAEWSSIRRRFR
jgi:hypothetical protein